MEYQKEQLQIERKDFTISNPPNPPQPQPQPTQNK